MVGWPESPPKLGRIRVSRGSDHVIAPLSRLSSRLPVAATRRPICCTPSSSIRGFARQIHQVACEPSIAQTVDRSLVLLAAELKGCSPVRDTPPEISSESTVETSNQLESSSIQKPGGVGVRKPWVVDVLN